MADEEPQPARGVNIVKVRAFAAENAQTSNVVGQDQKCFVSVGALEPPYQIWRLAELYEESSALRPNVEAYATNIEGFGYTFKPTIDLDASDARERVHEAMMVEKLCDGELPAVTPEEIDAKLVEVRATMRIEKIFIDAWFKQCTDIVSFVGLRKQRRRELEITGNAYWECLRTPSGRLQELVPAPSVGMRLMPLDQEWTEVSALRRVSPIGLRRMTRRRQLRRYVQIVDGMEAAYFKEFGDQRVFSSRTGRRYASLEALHVAEPKASPATELLHFRIPSLLSAYGVPRWIGAVPAVVGSRRSEEVNVAYFKDKCIPPMVIFVEGGALSAESGQRIEEMIRTKIRGSENFHSMLLLETAPVTAGGMNGLGPNVAPKIHIEPLSHFQQQDALFQKYEERNEEKVGVQFRLPRLLRGLMSDFNRATAEAASETAEQQVFEPERQDEDHLVNHRILPDLGIRFWEFQSSGPVVRNPPELMKMVAEAVHENILTPGEGRELVADVFSREFPKLDAEWTKGPVAALTRAGTPAAEMVKELFAARQEAERREQEGFAREDAAVRARENAEVIEMPHAEFQALLRQG